MEMERARTHTHTHECCNSKMGNPIENFIANFSIYYIVVIKIYLNVEVSFHLKSRHGGECVCARMQ